MAAVPVNSAMAIPFAIDSSGTVAVEQVPVKQLADRVTALASTQPGERVMAARFGVDTANLLYAIDDPLAAKQLAIGLMASMKIFEPGAVLTGVVPVSNTAGTGVAAIRATAVPATAQVGAPARASVVVRADGTVITSS